MSGERVSGIRQGYVDFLNGPAGKDLMEFIETASETCLVKGKRTNDPMEALVLLQNIKGMDKVKAHILDKQSGKHERQE